MVELNKRFIEGYMHFQHEPKVQQLRKNVLKYNRSVRDLGLRDHQASGILFIFGYELILCFEGPEGKTRWMEESGATSLSYYTPSCMDNTSPSGCYFERPHLPSRVHNFAQESQRHVSQRLCLLERELINL